jgi:uncharacterized protein
LLLDDEGCAFFTRHNFLVGLSVDGPREIHDTYRKDRRGAGTFDLVMGGLRYLKKHEVEFNILCTVNAANQDHGRAVYRFLRDELGARWIQFIPIVERATPETIEQADKGWGEHPGRSKRLLYTQTGNMVTQRSVGPLQYGRFLIDIYEEWLRRDIGRVHVQLFEVTFEAYFGRYRLCIHAPTCGLGPALEHNGDLYACDHYVEPDYKLGNIHETPMGDLVASAQMRKFGNDKRDTLTKQCRECEVRFLCGGGCPKDRFALSSDGEAGQNYLCAGLESFFRHSMPSMKHIVKAVQAGKTPQEIMAWVAAMDAGLKPSSACPCGSGRRFKFCHGKETALVHPETPDVQP